MKGKRIAIIVIVVIILAVIIGLNVKNSGRNVPTVQVEVVSVGPIREIVRADGEIKAEKQVDIGSDIMGRIEKIYVELGDYVNKGDTLCLIDRQSYEVKVKSLEITLDNLKTQLEKVKKDYERMQNLFEKELVAEADLENARIQYESLKAQYESTFYSLQDAQYSLNKTVILAPISGKVISINKEVGEIVVMGTVNTSATVIMTIAELSKMKVDAYVDESEVVRVKDGYPAEVSVTAYNNKTFKGVVKALSAAPYQSTSTTSSSFTTGITYPVEISIVDSGVLYPGMTATCEIIVASKDSVVKVPIQALGKDSKSGEDYLFVITGGQAIKQPVKVGLIATNEAEIMEGVSKGDTVAVAPYTTLRTLKDGQKVKVAVRKKGSMATTKGKSQKG